MLKIKNKFTLLGVRIFALAAFLIFIILIGHCYTVIEELRLKIKESHIVGAQVTQNKSIIESDTTIKKSHLFDLLTFSDSPQFIENAIAENHFEQKGDSFYVLKEIILPSIFENDCQLIRCVQIKQSFENIPSSIWKALLGTEDFRFLEHRGVDPLAIIRAVIVDLLAMKFVQGGSTLTQQLMKNLFLTNERSLARKFKELIFALYIENIMEKEEIITLYLNEVFWGTIQGVQLKGYHAASLAYFNKQPRELSDFEATVLVSLLKGPTYYRPSSNIDGLNLRATAVYKRLQDLNLMSRSAENFWKADDWNNFKKKYVENINRNHFKIYNRLSKNSEMVLGAFEKYVFYDAVLKNRERLSERAQGADIAIKAIIANKDCEGFDCKNAFSYYSKLERDKRVSITNEYHQIGSLFKPIVYDTFIKFGRKYDEEVSTQNITLNLKSGPWSPKDYSKAHEDKILLKTALQKSKNIPLIRIASEVGFDKMEESLGLLIPRLKTPLAEYPAQLLGAIELSLEEVFLVYRKFIMDKCTSIKSNNESLEQTILYFMSVASETTISKIAKAPLKNAYVFGKTGTSNDGLDNWYFAFDGKQIYVIWYGVESERDKHDIRISGASSSFMIFQDFINNRGKQISEIHCE